MYRMAKLEPWYHQSAPRCHATTLAKDQCVFSAKYEGTRLAEREIKLCKTHADMADFPVRRIPTVKVLVRED